MIDLAVLIIFFLTYAFLSFQSVSKKFGRPAASTIGATLILVSGALTLDEAFLSIDFHTIMLLLGMMIIVAYLGISGFFDFLAYKILKFAKNGKKLLATIIFSSGFLSALFVNDTICVFMTPVILRISSISKINAIPLLIALAVSANIGSAATIVGNPQNMLIGIASKINFVEFVINVLPSSLAGLIIAFFIIYFLYKKNLHKEVVYEESSYYFDKNLAKKSLAVFVLVLIFFITEIYPISLSAMIGATALFLIGGRHPKEVLDRVDWGLLLLFCNLFIVTHAFEKYYGNLILEAFKFTGSFESYLYISMLTVVGSNLVSNVPFVMLSIPAAKSIGGDIWYLLAMASTFAGNLTIIGSVANLIVVESAARRGVVVTFSEYLKVGVPVTVLSVIAGDILLYLL